MKENIERNKKFEVDEDGVGRDNDAVGELCANCKWEVAAIYDAHYNIYRCSDCGSEL